MCFCSDLWLYGCWFFNDWEQIYYVWYCDYDICVIVIQGLYGWEMSLCIFYVGKCILCYWQDSFLYLEFIL